MAWVKVIISFFVVATMEYSLERNPNASELTKHVFEISMSILCAGWIANPGW